MDPDGPKTDICSKIAFDFDLVVFKQTNFLHTGNLYLQSQDQVNIPPNKISLSEFGMIV